MAEINLKVAVNRSQRISFTQGEDRALTFSLYDEAEGLPLDLTGAQLTFGLPRYGGGTIKRRTGVLAFGWSTAQTLNGLSVIGAASHGLVSGDVVTLEPPLGVDLPAPFAAGTAYTVSTEDNDTFSLLASDGTPLALTFPSLEAAWLVLSDFAVTNALIGQAVLAVNSKVSAACSIGQGQTWQLTYRGQDGLNRIYTGTSQLDIFAQPLP